MSLDGFVAGPDQSAADPIGRGGMRLHEWHLQADEPVLKQVSGAGRTAASDGCLRHGPLHVRPGARRPPMSRTASVGS